MESIPPTYPFHVNKAYGVRGPTRAPLSVRPVTPSTPAQISDGMRVDPRVSRLVAGVVPGGVSFEGGTPKPTAERIPFYRHPADKNAAATSVNLGRVIDTNG
jgi:hypothetical protein